MFAVFGIIDIVEYQKILTIMKNKLHIFLILAVIALLIGCQKDPDSLFGGDNDGKLRLTLSIGEQDEIATYSAATVNECLIDDVVVLVFDGATDKYIAGECIDSTSDRIAGNNGDVLRVITVNIVPKSNDKIVVLVNSGKTTIPLTPGISTRDDINSRFPLRGLTFLNATVGQHMPMSGEAVYTGGGTMTCPVCRSVAKVELVIADDLKDVTGAFTPESVVWYMGNVADPTTIGAIYAPASASDCVIRPGGNFKTDASILKGLLNNQSGLSNTYYLPEYPSATKASGGEADSQTWTADRTYLLVVSGARYYRIDLYDHTTGKFIDIRRNTHIKVTVREVKSAGYASETQARTNPGSNLEYEIEAKGPNDDLVISNGLYALSLSNNKIFIWGPSGDYEVARIRYILPKGMTSLPAGVTCTIGSPGMSTLQPYPITVTDQDQPFIIKCTSSEFSPEGSSSTIKIRLGNIVKDFYIEYHPLMDAHGLAILFNGRVPADVRWLRNENGYSFLNHSDGTFSLIAPENVTPVKWVKYDDNGNEMPSSESDLAAAPIFEYKYGEASIPYSDPDNFDIGKIKVIIGQRWPQYVGWWGGEPGQSGTTHYSKRLIAETIYESLALPSAPDTFNASGAQDMEMGKANTLYLMDQSQTGAIPSEFKQAYRCYMLNDRNGNGRIDPDEPILWYQPARNQCVGIYVQLNGISEKEDFSGGSLSSTAIGMNFSSVGLLSGIINYLPSSQTGGGRCVRDL